MTLNSFFCFLKCIFQESPTKLKLNCWKKKKVPLLLQFWGLNTEPHACLSGWSTTIKLHSKPLGNYIRSQGSLKDEPQNPNGRHEELLKISSPQFKNCLVSIFLYMNMGDYPLNVWVCIDSCACMWKPDVYQ